MNVTLRQIEAFVAVAQHGQFSVGAQRLHVSPSALSMLIRQLEEQIGARLFDRHTRFVRLTDIGAEFLPAASKVIADLEVAITHSRDRSSLRRGRVAVATSTVMASTLVPWVIRRFALANPGIEVVLKDVAEQEIRRLVRVGDVDLGVGTAMSDDGDADFAVEPLLEDRLVALVPPDHALAQKRSVTWRDLAGQPFVALGSGSPLRSIVDRAFASIGAGVTPAYEVSFSSTVISLVANGMGVSALPLNARQLTSKVRVAVRPLVRPVMPRRVCVFRRRDIGLSPAAEAFQSELRAHVRAGGFPVAAQSEHPADRPAPHGRA
ncbi:MAG TPA: LysR family transcriptional regulator [Burkholderiaceae bacterium]|nr:LysR family transcriptional regulator [Burkholderiaceae bacterium]